MEAWCLLVDILSHQVKELILKVVKYHRLWDNKQNEHKAVKQLSGPTIYLGKDDESKLITM